MDREKAQRAIEEISQFFRSEWDTPQTFEGWPGLPQKRGQQPTGEEANEFFLGCCIDYMTKTRIVWENARRFCHEVVPADHRDNMWRWIADHSEAEWDRKKSRYNLHRFAPAHRRVHRIATLITRLYDGDVRRVWTDSGRKPLLSILQDDLKIGPALSRMVIIGLRDHDLVALEKCDPKPDVHVCRLMHGLGLASSTIPKVVLEAARKLFKDPGKADTALYHLGADYGVKSARQFWKVYETINIWKSIRSVTQTRIEAAIDSFSSINEGWEHEPCGSSHWAAVYLYKTKGRLQHEMENDLWVWLGVGFDREIVLWSEVGEYEKYFAPLAVRSAIRQSRFEREETRTRGRESWWRESRLDARKLSDPGYLELQVGRAAEKLKAIIDHVEIAAAA